jgi:hypothetical protein
MEKKSAVIFLRLSPRLESLINRKTEFLGVRRGDWIRSTLALAASEPNKDLDRKEGEHERSDES